MSSKDRFIQERRKINKHKLDYIKSTPPLEDDLLNVLITDPHSKQPIYLMNSSYRHLEMDWDAPLTLDFVKIRPQIDMNEGIVPAFFKSYTERRDRTQHVAEVMTPEYVVRAQMSLVDMNYWDNECPFNRFDPSKLLEQITITDPIPFSNSTQLTHWQEYIKLNRLEITCGEAPYITTRYCHQKGHQIPIKQRSGFLDRKLRVVTENVSDEKEWREWALNSVKFSHGYELQGDNIFLARQNILYSVCEYYTFAFNTNPPAHFMYELATVISWNINQLNGLTFKHPLFEDQDVYLYDWEKGKVETWSSQNKGKPIISSKKQSKKAPHPH